MALPESCLSRPKPRPLTSRRWIESDRGIDTALVVLAVAVALVVRLVGMGHPLLPDEGYTWLVGSAPGASGFLRRLAVYENTPPLYYLLLTPLSLDSEWWIRLPSLIGGVISVAVLFAVVRPTLGRGTAVLASLGLAIAPYAVAESNFGRAYMLADVGMLTCFGSAVRLAEGRSAWWWWLYGVGAAAAIYSEYNAAFTLVPLVIGLVWLRPERRWQTLGLGVLPALSLVPWIPQLVRSLNDLDVTKTGLGYLTVTPGSARDQLIALYYGSTGQNLGPAARTLALVVLLGVMAAGVRAMARRGAAARPLLVLVGFAGVGTLVLTALAPAVGIGIFNVGYLTILIPVGVIPLAAAIAAIPIRAISSIAAVALMLAGAAFAVKRSHKAPDINPAAIDSAIHADHARTILTNSAVIAYYFRRNGVILDRPFNLGPELQQDCTGCTKPIAVVDDANVGNGARPGPGTAVRIGHYFVRLLHSARHD